MGGYNSLKGRTLRVSLKLLPKVTDLLEEHEIIYWLESGTLLGIIRENRLLPWDNDLDLGIREEDVHRITAIFYKFWLRGFKTHVSRHKREDPPFIKKNVRIIKIFNSIVGNIMLDMLVKSRYQDYFYWAVGIKNYTKKKAPAHFYDNLETVKFNGKTYYIPADCEKYLTYRYGDWKTPRMEWDVYKDDRAIIDL
jgi:phosphorylcholine metabolism protein LicD